MNYNLEKIQFLVYKLFITYSIFSTIKIKNTIIMKAIQFLYFSTIDYSRFPFHLNLKNLILYFLIC